MQILHQNTLYSNFRNHSHRPFLSFCFSTNQHRQINKLAFTIHCTLSGGGLKKKIRFGLKGFSLGSVIRSIFKSGQASERLVSSGHLGAAQHRMTKVPEEPLLQITAAAARAHKQSCRSGVLTHDSLTHMLNPSLCPFFPVPEQASLLWDWIWPRPKELPSFILMCLLLWNNCLYLILHFIHLY